MRHPLKSLGFNLLKNTLQFSKGAKNRVSLSRRSFLLLGAALSSCRNTVEQGPLAMIPGPKGPIPQNPTMRFKSDFSIKDDITYRQVLVSGKYIAMTFDDGPHPQNTPRLLNILRQRNIKATFYVIGRSVQSHPEVLRQTIAEGHEIGNHTQTHRLLSKLGDDQVRWEFDKCRDAVKQASGYEMRTMRPPYGGLTQRQRALAFNEYGYPTILWSVDPLDWKRPGPSVVASRILNNTSQGGIVLAHDLHAGTVSAMPETLDGLLQRGFKFVTVSQLIAMQREPAEAPPAETKANF